MMSHHLINTETKRQWSAEADFIKWHKKWESIVEVDENLCASWFHGGRLNVCENLLDVNIDKGLGDNLALIHHSPMLCSSDESVKITYYELKKQVCALANFLNENLKICKGDVVIIYTPQCPFTMIAMLACARLGAIYSVVFGGFSAYQLADRIRHSEAKLVITSTFGIRDNGIRYELYKLAVEAIQMAQKDSHQYKGVKVQSCLVFRRPEGDVNNSTKPRSFEDAIVAAEQIMGVNRDDKKMNEITTEKVSFCQIYDYTKEISDKQDTEFAPVSVESEHPLFIIYTSGTTGLPKGLVFTSADTLLSKRKSIREIYKINPGDVMFSLSDFGWIVGQSFGCYGTLACGGTSIIYEAKVVDTPDHLELFRASIKYSAKVIIITPTAVRHICSKDPTGDHLRRFIAAPENANIEKLYAIYMGGESCEESTREWLRFVVPNTCGVFMHWGQTELGGVGSAISADIARKESSVTKKPYIISKGSTGKPVLGFCYHFVPMSSTEQYVPIKGGQDEENKNIGEQSELAQEEKLQHVLIKLPMPPGVAVTLWKNHKQFLDTYLSKFKGYYDTKDTGFMDDAEHLYIVSRNDDIIKVGSRRISTLAIEEAVYKVPGVKECCVLTLADSELGQKPVVLVVRQTHGNSSDKRDTEVDKHEFSTKVLNGVNDLIGETCARVDTVIVVLGLPQTKTGKIPRFSLNLMANGKDSIVPSTVEDASVYNLIYSELHAHGIPAVLPQLPG